MILAKGGYKLNGFKPELRISERHKARNWNKCYYEMQQEWDKLEKEFNSISDGETNGKK